MEAYFFFSKCFYNFLDTADFDGFVRETLNQYFFLCLALVKARICIAERIRILYFLALSHVAMFYATTEQKLIHSFWNALRNALKINQLHQSSCYTSSIYYTTQSNPWICRYRFNGKVFLIFSVSPLIHVK